MAVLAGVCGLVCMYFTQGMLGHFFYSRTIRDCYYRPTADYGYWVRAIHLTFNYNEELEQGI